MLISGPPTSRSEDRARHQAALEELLRHKQELAASRRAALQSILPALGPISAEDAVLVKGSRVAGLEKLAALLVSR